MSDWKSPKEWKRLFRYYQAGLINMAFGFSLYALFVRLGMNIYVAQIISHLMGMAFNYFTYSRYAFAGHTAQRNMFIVSYTANYFLNVVTLFAMTLIIKSPYLSGLIATIFVSLLNYFALKKFVFREQKA